MKLEEVARVRSTHGALPYPQQKIFDGRIFRLVELVPPPVSLTSIVSNEAMEPPSEWPVSTNLYPCLPTIQHLSPPIQISEKPKKF
jgi:hypothetical protein